MSLHLRADETPAHGTRRVARQKLALAVRALRGKAPASVRVHGARKHLKKLRALLRLVRDQTGAGFFRTNNRQLRDLGQQLAPWRDAEVARLTLIRMRRAGNTTEARRALAHLRRILAAESPAANRDAAVRQVATELVSLRRAVADWPLDGLTWARLARRIGQTYRQSRVEREHFRLRRDLDHLHEWRKRSKDLWYQLQLVRPLVRPAARKLLPRLKLLTETQGRMHDVQLVLDALQRHQSELAVWEREAVREIADDQLAGFTGDVLAQGRRVLRETPRDFGRLLRTQPR